MDLLRPIDDSQNLIFGSAFHKFLENHYLNEAIEIPTDVEDLELFLQMTSGYLDHYKNEEFEVVMVEGEFEVPFLEDFFCGKFDMLVKVDGKYWLVEHKTAAKFDSNYEAKILTDMQSVAYIWAVQKKLNIKIEGIIYNVAVKRFPVAPKMLKNGTLSKAKGQNISYRTYLKEIENNGLNVEDYRDILGHLKEFPKVFFHREFIVFPEKAFLDWIDLLTGVLKDIKGGIIYKNVHNCYQYGKCQFASLCESENPELIIDLLYKEKEIISTEIK